MKSLRNGWIDGVIRRDKKLWDGWIDGWTGKEGSEIRVREVRIG